ncbi:hypothetical protein Poli38472_000867 [Pythium oligandrum]|uniref:Uncharacterized protein n=1 Tax=Pythium oligandrum TaxID=41045 RepID=A0A8K1FER2_PYTOL|nr:hypothetical protein Poli38472_000867 [Pythium oligandrum]|eukprot:TMW60825.1 hypothetical protein Poli38472_000867 [Pythium oligandrum]
MWKNSEQEEYEASAPAVKAHFHALRAEEAWKKDDFAQAELEARTASERFIEAANSIVDKRTAGALLLLAENYAYRSNEARARLPETEKTDQETQKEPSSNSSRPDTTSGISTLKDAHAGSNGGATVAGFTPMSTGLEDLDPKASAEAENQLNQAASEMEELWQRLNELGLSTSGGNDKTNLLMSSRHLSSSLGDSFCLLPTKARTPIGVNATAIDGGSTLRAAIASRMRNQRVRLMEKQYGPRAAVDTRLHPPKQSNSSTERSSNPFKDGGPVIDPSYADSQHQDRRSSLSGRGSDLHDIENLQETISHQKYEIVRLLNTVKTLSNENTTLLKKCDTLSNVQNENRDLQGSMEKFKAHYNQKLVMIKRALEEWRRQQNNQSHQAAPSSSPGDPARVQQLQSQLQAQQQQIAQLNESMKKKDEQLAKYDKWYQTLKAGARAKRSRDSNGMAADGSSIGGSFARDSFTNSNSLHELGGRSVLDDMSRSSGSPPLARPPAHPTRRAL